MVLVSMVSRSAAIYMIGLVFSFSIVLQAWWHFENSNLASSRKEAANYIRENYSPGTCVGFSHEGIDNSSKHVFWFDFGVALFDYDLKRMNFEQWNADCSGPFVAYEQNLENRGEVFPIAISPLAGPVVWAKGRSPIKEYPITVAGRSVRLVQMLGKGWHSLEREHVWSSHRAELKLPIPDDCRSGGCEAVLMFTVFGATESRPVSVTFMPDKPSLVELPTFVATNGILQRYSIPLLGRGSSVDLVLEIPAATSPHDLHLSRDKRILGIALHSVELINRVK